MFAVKSPERAKRVAKSLAADLKARGYQNYPYSRCLDLVAKMFGYSDFGALSRLAGTVPVSADDAASSLDVVSDRRRHQIAVLVGAGLIEKDAAHAVDSVKPTDRAAPRKDIGCIMKFSGAMKKYGKEAFGRLIFRQYLQRTLDLYHQPNEDVIAVFDDTDFLEHFDSEGGHYPEYLIAALMTLQDERCTLQHLFREILFLVVGNLQRLDDEGEAIPHRNQMVIEKAVYAVAGKDFLDKRFDKEFPDAKVDLFENVDDFFQDIPERILAAAETDLVLAKRILEELCEPFQEAIAAGGTLRDLAVAIMRARYMMAVPGVEDYRVRQDVTDGVLDISSMSRVIDARKIERALRKSFSAFAKNGFPDGLLAYWEECVRTSGTDYSAPMPDGVYALVTDVFVVAGIDGLSLADFAASIKKASQMEIEAAKSDRSFRGDIDAAKSKIDSINVGDGKDDVSLMLAALAIGVTWWGTTHPISVPRSPLITRIEDLMRFHANGYTLADLAVMAMLNSVANRAKAMALSDQRHQEFRKKMGWAKPGGRKPTDTSDSFRH